jgi:hypothetical protein
MCRFTLVDYFSARPDNFLMAKSGGFYS